MRKEKVVLLKLFFNHGDIASVAARLKLSTTYVGSVLRQYRENDSALVRKSLYEQAKDNVDDMREKPWDPSCAILVEAWDKLNLSEMLEEKPK